MDTKIDTLPELKKWSQELPLGTETKKYLSNLSVAFFWRVSFLFVIGFTLIYLVINVLISWQWVDKNFAGFMHQNQIVTQSDLPGWELSENKIGAVLLETGDLLLIADDLLLESSAQLIEYIQPKQLGYPINYTLYRQNIELMQTVPVALFSTQNFIQLVAIPAFLAFVVLITIGAIAYLRLHLTQVRLFVLFSLSLVYFLVSFPEFMTSKLFVFHFTLFFIGKITMPIFLLHFLFIFPYPRPALKNWTFLLPLIYLPLLPGLIHIPILLIQPETTRNFNMVINSYTLLYGFVGAGLLIQAVLQTKNTTRKQAIVLLIGLTLPPLLLTSIGWVSLSTINYSPIYSLLVRYSFIGVPIAIAIMVVWLGLFDIKHTNRSHFFYMLTIIIVLLGYFTLLILIQSISLNFNIFSQQNFIIIVGTTAGFFGIHLIYRWGYRWWLDNHFYSTVEDFKIGLRIFSRELLKIGSRRDLERLISWEIASDFRLRSAELVSTDKPTIPYALMLPLKVSNLSLGTLFLGAKIDGKDFAADELKILTELQKQLALAVWSLELDQTIQATEQLTRLKSKFLTNVTHELRTPLNGIINYIGFVLDDYRDDLTFEQVNYLERALDSAEQLLVIINNILDMSKMEVGQMTLHLQPTNLTNMVTETMPQIQDLINSKPIDFITEISPTLPHLSGDHLRLRQILLNMLSNAAKFTEAGSIFLRVYPENSSVVIQVEDTGIGIDEKTLPTIFQHFISSGLTDRSQHLGPGLSMPITKSLVELHGGHLDVKSQPGQGTIFTVTLPLNPEN